MSRKFIREKKVSENYIAKYFLLEESGKEILYGVEIELYDINNMELKTHESIRKLTQSYNSIMDIINLLAKHDVTPNSLLYVIDEIFDSVQN